MFLYGVEDIYSCGQFMPLYVETCERVQRVHEQKSGWKAMNPYKHLGTDHLIIGSLCWLNWAKIKIAFVCPLPTYPPKTCLLKSFYWHSRIQYFFL